MKTALAAIAAALLAAPASLAAQRDPFATYEAATPERGNKPLQRWSLEQIKLRGVVVGTASPRALLETPDGVTHVARAGDLLGTAWGRIKVIRGGAIVVEETFRGPLGDVYRNRTELKLR